jgi:ATP-dependent DNA ligase
MDIFDSKGIKPMLIAEQVDPYDDPDSIFELKVDGIRCIAYCDNTSVDLRNKRDIKLLPRFPELMNIYKSCQKKCILDGELNVLVNGKPDFYEVQKRTLLSDPFKIQLAYTKHPANFVAYDVLYYKDKLITDLPLIERKQILNNVVSENQLISVSRYVETSGKMLFELAKQQNLEGVVGKKKDSLYWFGKRTKDWNKIKVMADYEAIAIAYIPKPNNMTSLVLAKYNANNSLIITNHVTLGVSLSKLKQYGIKYSNCPFLEIPKGHENAVWIEPVVCTIEYMPSEKGGLRQAVFKGIRDDKLSEECRLDKIGE